MDLAVGEPQAGQFVLGAGLAVVGEAVATGVTVPDDGGVETVAQVLEVPFERGERDLEFVEQRLSVDDASFGEQLVDTVEPLGAVHRATSCGLDWPQGYDVRKGGTSGSGCRRESCGVSAPRSPGFPRRASAGAGRAAASRAGGG